MAHKHIKISNDAHKKLSELKNATGAKTYSEVIISLIETSKEYYLNNGKLTTKDKQIVLTYDKGQLVEIEVIRNVL